MAEGFKLEMGEGPIVIRYKIDESSSQCLRMVTNNGINMIDD